MGFFSRYKKTNFEAGGCMLEDIPLGADTVARDPQFIAPRRIDYRDMLVQSSNQGQTPHCVGYSTAGCCEYWHWKKKHFPQQFDGDAIYAKAKSLDQRPNVNGTWPNFGAMAAIQLGFIQGTPKYVNNNIQDIKFTLHEHGPFVGGFLITTDWNIVDKKNGMIKFTPGAAKRGGHAVCVCGYSEDEGLYIQNSWSDQWGIYGFAILGWEQVNSQFMNGMAIIPA